MSPIRLSKFIVSAALMAAFTGCAWVDLKPEGEKVRVLSSSEVKRCKHLGHVTSNTAATVGFFARGASTVREELNRLARNHAGGMGGDSIVPTGPMLDGGQTYDVYRCINP
jgi:hypothetical protein